MLLHGEVAQAPALPLHLRRIHRGTYEDYLLLLALVVDKVHWWENTAGTLLLQMS